MSERVLLQGREQHRHDFEHYACGCEVIEDYGSSAMNEAMWSLGDGPLEIITREELHAIFHESDA